MQEYILCVLLFFGQADLPVFPIMWLFDQARPYTAHGENSSFIRCIFKEAIYRGDAIDFLERHVSIYGILMTQSLMLTIPKCDFDDSLA